MTTRVLIVDDHPELRMLVRVALEDEQPAYDIREAGNGREALSLLDSFAPQVIILDLMLPGGIDGYHVCEHIRKTGGARPAIIMLSARGQRSDIEKGKAAGADIYLVKPFSPGQLVTTVREAFLAFSELR